MTSLPNPNSTHAHEERLRIGIYGRTNSGKSSLINALTGQTVSLVSERAGTTTDPVRKLMELPGTGAALLIDTPGFEDKTPLGQERERLALSTTDEVDLAILLCSPDMSEELRWMKRFRLRETPVIVVLPKRDIVRYAADDIERVTRITGEVPIPISVSEPDDIALLYERIRTLLTSLRQEERTLTGTLCGKEDVVMLIMPQDESAPKGRLILPQVQTIRELLDKQCTVVCVTPEGMETALGSLRKSPDLIITDSQAFRYVFERKPAESRLTSFSILFAALKGDATIFRDGAKRLESLSPDARILIAEACTHAPRQEDIGRVKLPAMLRRRFGDELQIHIRSGKEFPDDLSGYDLIIHCGACMFNRKLVMSRLAQAVDQGVPMTNYGMAIAQLGGILDSVELPR